MLQHEALLKLGALGHFYLMVGCKKDRLDVGCARSFCKELVLRHSLGELSFACEFQGAVFYCSTVLYSRFSGGHIESLSSRGTAGVYASDTIGI